MRRSMMARLIRWLVPLTIVLACSESLTETPAAPPSPSASPSVIEPATPAASTPSTPSTSPAPPAVALEPTAASEPEVPTEPEPAEPNELTDADRVQAYVADCSHRFEIVDEEYGDPEHPDTECDYVEWDQHCVPDPGDCWGSGQGCLRSCGTPCNACQDQCASGCDRCKAECTDGSTDCNRACAEARLACRNTCMDARSECDGTCSRRESQCAKAFVRKREKKCPQCNEISRCLGRSHDEDDYEAACAREFPRARKECFAWCFQDYESSDPWDLHVDEEP